MTDLVRYAQDPATALVAAARAAGTSDNATAVVVDNVFLPRPLVSAAA
jgi:serine/threonine protein phosphatase PrpC